MLTGTPVLTKDFSWDVTLNWGQNRTECVELADGLTQFVIGETRMGKVVAREGSRYGDIVSTAYKRDANGNIIVNEKFIDQYEEIGGFNALKRAVKMDGEEIASEIALCGVKGRGGAAYDMGRKWSQAKAVDSPKKVVICNADEGEPCTFKDRSIITKDPFRLIEGLIIAGYAINAQNGYIYIGKNIRT